MTENPWAGIATDNEYALPVIRWQPVQWQATVMIGGALIRNRTWPQRQPPSRDPFGSLIARSLLGFVHRNSPMDVRPPST
jgi:hypothetical protein